MRTTEQKDKDRDEKCEKKKSSGVAAARSHRRKATRGHHQKLLRWLRGLCCWVNGMDVASQNRGRREECVEVYVWLSERE